MASSQPAAAASKRQYGYHTSLLTAQDCRDHVHLILGSNPLAASRATHSLAAGAKPIFIAPPPAIGTELHYGVAAHISSGAVTHLARPFADDDLFTLGRTEVDGVVDAVFVTTTAGGVVNAQKVSALCKKHRIPINVVDAPALCSFSLLSSNVDGPLQIGVTTNGRGCKLASRIRREVAAALPTGLGAACARLGDVRKRIVDEDHRKAAAAELTVVDGGDEGVDDSIDQAATFNKLITEAADDAKTRRMRWLAQVCEYWPLKRLAAITDADVAAILESYPGTANNNNNNGHSGPRLGPSPGTTGRIILAGSGPGHPDLLTRATCKAIQAADLVLADKLVPGGVLDLIPRRTPVSIARKFPGNADRAQEELLEQALAGVRAGKTVLRLKQGDPFIYGRGGEEVNFFRRQGGLGDDRIIVLPGITSSLSAPLFAGIPATQRDVADQVLICTGTGKKGKPPVPPEYVESRTVVFLMALHRIGGLVAELTRFTDAEEEKEEEQEGVVVEDDNSESKRTNGNGRTRSRNKRALWPLNTPCAVIERASCPDQRVIRTTLKYVAEAIEQEGSRPPGLLVVGRACEVLYAAPLKKGRSWVVEDEGFKGLDLDDLSPIGTAEMMGIAALA
ncbi:tetrapyrrole methylase [Apodospora peruviana]|uniref:precorrin-2 dehydrogenase n=1 Tax=Apodospora peruviana TaxID=516989 RepID=A0AAE0ISU4_9PEZI|nr:tetrapyrrole methylase [Apodospora peruviana]